MTNMDRVVRPPSIGGTRCKLVKYKDEYRLHFASGSVRVEPVTTMRTKYVVVHREGGQWYALKV